MAQTAVSCDGSCINVNTTQCNISFKYHVHDLNSHLNNAIVKKISNKRDTNPPAIYDEMYDFSFIILSHSGFELGISLNGMACLTSWHSGKFSIFSSSNGICKYSFGWEHFKHNVFDFFRQVPQYCKLDCIHFSKGAIWHLSHTNWLPWNIEKMAWISSLKIPKSYI